MAHKGSYRALCLDMTSLEPRSIPNTGVLDEDLLPEWIMMGIISCPSLKYRFPCVSHVLTLNSQDHSAKRHLLCQCDKWEKWTVGRYVICPQDQAVLKAEQEPGSCCHRDPGCFNKHHLRIRKGSITHLGILSFSFSSWSMENRGWWNGPSTKDVMEQNMPRENNFSFSPNSSKHSY